MGDVAVIVGVAGVIAAVATVVGQLPVKSVVVVDGLGTSMENVELILALRTDCHQMVDQNVENAAVVYSAENAAGGAHWSCCPATVEVQVASSEPEAF